MPGDTTVTIGTTTIPAVAVAVNPEGTTATVRTPPGASGHAPVIVTTTGGSTAALPFTYTAAPTSATLTPDFGPTSGRTTVTVDGSGFAAGATSVEIDTNDLPATAVTVNAAGTTASFTTPADAPGNVPVTLTTNGVTATPALTYTYLPSTTNPAGPIPNAVSLDPGFGPAAGGTKVTITGGWFLRDATSVTIGGRVIPAGSVKVNAAGTKASFFTPGHPIGVVSVVVSTTAGTSSPALHYVYLPGGTNATVAVPASLSLTPVSGPGAGGTSVTVTGMWFLPRATSVTIGGVRLPDDAVKVNATGTAVTFLTPTHAVGIVTVAVSTMGGTSSPLLQYSYLPGGTNTKDPRPSGPYLTPGSGPTTGGTPVTVTGTGFETAATWVSIGGITIPAADVAVNPAGTSATFSTPAHAAGNAAVTLLTSGGASPSALNYVYVAASPVSRRGSPETLATTGFDLPDVSTAGFLLLLTGWALVRIGRPRPGAAPDRQRGRR